MLVWFVWSVTVTLLLMALCLKVTSRPRYHPSGGMILPCFLYRPPFCCRLSLWTGTRPPPLPSSTLITAFFSLSPGFEPDQQRLCVFGMERRCCCCWKLHLCFCVVSHRFGGLQPCDAKRGAEQVQRKMNEKQDWWSLKRHSVGKYCKFKKEYISN